MIPTATFAFYIRLTVRSRWNGTEGIVTKKYIIFINKRRWG